MEFTEYQTLSAKTAQFSQQDSTYKLMYLSMGLAGETGEVIEKVKKVIRNDGGAVSEEKRSALTLELGDVLWYLSQLAHELGVPFEDVAQGNLSKLADRAKRGVITSEGDNR